MSRLTRRAVQGLRKAYLALPEGPRRRMASVARGETTAQRRMTRRALDARERWGAVPGHGDLTVGSATNPYRAVVVDRFDAMAHVEGICTAVTAVLDEADIPAYRLPGKDGVVLVVSSDDWDRAWASLVPHPRMQSMWIGTSKHNQRAVGELKGVPQQEVCRVFQHLVSARGDLVADERMNVRLERWSTIDVEGMPRPDGGAHRVGTLRRGEQWNSFASYLSPDVQAALRDGSIGALPRVDEVCEPIDLVYTWVDGSDPAWAAKRERWTTGGRVSSDARLTARFENRDELLYSLRSVEMFASWFRRIFLVTDAQVPDWLNPEHPKLTVVDHSELFSEAELPLFNSHAIESRLHHIDGLSEQFLYLNDDMFFGSPVRPEHFFTGGKVAKYFPSRAHIDPSPRHPDDVSVSSAAKNNRALLEGALGRTMTAKLKHTPYAHRRSVLEEMEQRFPEVFADNVSARFRSPDDHAIVSSLAQRYGAATGRAVEATIEYNYVDISRPGLKARLARWSRARKYHVFCLNDTDTYEMTPENIDAVDEFLASYFPLPSQFER